jgi:uncharacterized protein YdaU (DUF1376 family)
MPMFWGDYLRDTGHLSPAEHGAYLMLIAHQWTTAKPLPDDDAMLARIAKMTAREWRAAKRVIEPFFQVANCQWNHKRVERELIKAKEAYDKRSNAGSKGGATTQARRQYSSSNASSNATSPAQAYPKPKPKPNSIPLESFDSLVGERGLTVRMATIEKAREIAPGYDVERIERLWQEATNGSGMILHDPDAAFLGFVKKHVQENRL